MKYASIIYASYSYVKRRRSNNSFYLMCFFTFCEKTLIYKELISTLQLTELIFRVVKVKTE